MEIGRRLYYVLRTGEVVLDTGERRGDVIATTIDDDFKVYTALSRFNRGALGVMELDFGDFKEDFQKSSGIRVDVTGAEPTLLFSYPSEPGEEQPEEPVYHPPIQEYLAALEQQLTETQIALTESLEANLAAQEEIAGLQATMDENKAVSQAEVTGLQIALTEVYEELLVLTGGEKNG
jgi:hypothetical protein